MPWVDCLKNPAVMGCNRIASTCVWQWLSYLYTYITSKSLPIQNHCLISSFIVHSNTFASAFYDQMGQRKPNLGKKGVRLIARIIQCA